MPLDDLTGRALDTFLPGVTDLAGEVPHDVIGRRADGVRLPLVVTVAPLALGGGPTYSVVVVRDFGAAVASSPRRRASRSTRCWRRSATSSTPTPSPPTAASARPRRPRWRADPGRFATRRRRSGHGLDAGRPSRRPPSLRAPPGAALERRVDRKLGAHHRPRRRDPLGVVPRLARPRRRRHRRAWHRRRRDGQDGAGARAQGRRRRRPARGRGARGARGEAEHLARTDELTGVFNRRHFSESWPPRSAGRARGTDPPALLLLDVDHFKQVNDRHGHAVGDAVLVEVVAPRRAVRRPPTTRLARWGGEEFAVLLRGVARRRRAARARRAAPRRASRARPVVADGVERRASPSRSAPPASGAELTTPTRWSTPPTARCTRPSAAAATARLLLEWRRRGPRAERARGGRASREALALAASVREGRVEPARRAGRRARRRGRRAARPARAAWCCAAGSAAGCTTSARSRSPTASCASPARSTTTSGR